MYEVYNLLGVVEINVALAWALIESDGREPSGYADVQEQGLKMFGPLVEEEEAPKYINLFSYYVDKEKALTDESVDVTVPVILADIGEYGTPIIDGVHRMYKAYATGVETIPVHKLSAIETYCLMGEGRSLLFHNDGQTRNNSRIEEIKQLQKKLKPLKGAIAA